MPDFEMRDDSKEQDRHKSSQEFGKTPKYEAPAMPRFSQPEQPALEQIDEAVEPQESKPDESMVLNINNDAIQANQEDPQTEFGAEAPKKSEGEARGATWGQSGHADEQ